MLLCNLCVQSLQIFGLCGLTFIANELEVAMLVLEWKLLIVLGRHVYVGIGISKLHWEARLNKKSAVGPESGFTLMELIIVVGILAIALAVAIPSITDWLPNYRLKQTARNLHSAAMKAKGEAAKRNLSCALTFNQTISDDNWAYIVYLDVDRDCEYDSGEQIVDELKSWPKSVSVDVDAGGVGFQDNDEGHPTIVFRSNGIPTDNDGGIGNGTVHLINVNGKKQEVVINQTGSIRID